MKSTGALVGSGFTMTQINKVIKPISRLWYKTCAFYDDSNWQGNKTTLLVLLYFTMTQIQNNNKKRG